MLYPRKRDMTSRTRVNEKRRHYSPHPAEAGHDGRRSVTYRRRKQFWRHDVDDVEWWRHEKLSEDDDGRVQASAVCKSKLILKIFINLPPQGILKV